MLRSERCSFHGDSSGSFCLGFGSHSLRLAMPRGLEAEASATPAPNIRIPVYSYVISIGSSFGGFGLLEIW